MWIHVVKPLSVKKVFVYKGRAIAPSEYFGISRGYNSNRVALVGPDPIEEYWLDRTRSGADPDRRR